ncbi:hypothetical protein [Paenibacillus psychroresistens]|uniref:hypothetical protein n=1 Tax=Paenibacillus psychroresistens TaxID=1778678 RepID=UPI001390ED1A|nr:hypothetical protein [Paenibacillus psychroresistens]
MDFTIDITWITILLGITSCLFGYFALSPLLYGPSSRVMSLKGFFLKMIPNGQLLSSSNRRLGNIRRRKPSLRMIKTSSLAEEASPTPLLFSPSNTKTREEFLCIHGFIQSLRSCSLYSPSFSI